MEGLEENRRLVVVCVLDLFGSEKNAFKCSQLKIMMRERIEGNHDDTVHGTVDVGFSNEDRVHHKSSTVPEYRYSTVRRNILYVLYDCDGLLRVRTTVACTPPYGS